MALDDEQLMYRCYEKAVKASSPRLCSHKGCSPDYEKLRRVLGIRNRMGFERRPGLAADDFVIFFGAGGRSSTAGPGVGGVRSTASSVWATISRIPQKFGVPTSYADSHVLCHSAVALRRSRRTGRTLISAWGSTM